MPDMDCAQSRSYLECYADSELDPVTSAQLEKHLEHCVQCRQAAEYLTRLHSLIREAVPYKKAPERLVRQVRARVHRQDANVHRFGVNWFDWLRPVALVAVTALVTWFATIQFHDSPARQVLAESIFASHARATVTGHITDVESSERHTVKPWLSSKLDYSPPVEDLAAAGFPLAGGRLDYVANRPVAVLVYERRKHVIDVFIWPDGTQSATDTQVLSKNGYQTVHWTNNGMTFWAVSDLNAAELKLFSEKFVRPN
jgi:anti-sigma factor RsiW